MDKPVTMRIKELETNLVNAINESRLPMWVVRDVMKNLTEQTVALAEQEAQAEEQAYMESLKEEQ